MKRLIAISVPVVLALSACGGDDGGSAGGSTDAWCGLARELDDSGDALDDMNPLDPESVRAAYTEFRSTVDRARSAAPAEISDDVDTLANGVERVADELDAVDYNFLDLDLAFIEELDAEMTAASDRVDEFNRRECGIETGDTGTDTGTGTDTDTGTDTGASATTPDLPTSGTARDMIVTELVTAGFTEAEATCIVENLDLTDMNQFAEDPNAMLSVFDTCDISLERLAEFGG